MLQNATIDKAEKGEFSNSARDTIKFRVNDNDNSLTKEGENLVLESSNDIDFRDIVQPFVILPRELVERILLLLDTKYLLACKCVNREFNEIIQSSTLLQYSLACKAAGVIDNPQSPPSYAERFEALKKREDQWRNLKPIFEMTISIDRHTCSQICRSTEGVLLLIDHNQKDLNYCHLVSLPQDNPRWIRIPGHGPALDWAGILINFATALYEHDLIVNFISSDIGHQANIQRHSLDLVLLKFSTGEYHPLARHPRIHVQRSSEVNPWVICRIVADNLALVVHSEDGTSSDKLFIFDWKTGRKRLQHDASETRYLDPVFVSPELLLVPNRVLSHFEVWHLPPSQLNSKPPIQILSLKLPTVSSEYSISEFRCYGEPNPFLHSMPYLPPRPFFSSAEDSIMTVTIRMNPRASFNFIVHRRALLDTIQSWISAPLLKQQELPMWFTNEVAVHKIADPEDGSVQLEVQSKLVSTMAHARSSSRTRDSPTFATSHIPTTSEPSSVSSASSAKSSTSQNTFLQVPWAEWGPPISRWFEVNESHARWINHSNGQRCAFLDSNPLNKRELTVADFNSCNFRRNANMMARLRGGEVENSGSKEKQGKEEEEFEILDHKGVFSEEVCMGLKCMVFRAPDKYDFDLVLMDGERLLGAKLNRYDWEESIKVLYIG